VTVRQYSVNYSRRVSVSEMLMRIVMSMTFLSSYRSRHSHISNRCRS